VIQIKAKDVPKYRKMFSAKQKYKCPICEDEIVSKHSRAALDHCHKTGHIRAVLCGTCNRNEGKVLMAAKYMAKLGHLSRLDTPEFLRRIANYIDLHTAEPSGIIHNTFDLVKGKQKPVKRPRRK
jgi:hypothetical protein